MAVMCMSIQTYHSCRQPLTNDMMAYVVQINSIVYITLDMTSFKSILILTLGCQQKISFEEKKN